MSREVRLLLIIVTGSLVSLPVAAEDETEKRLTPAELFRQTSPAIVRVCAYDAQGRQKGQGTGFFISEDGMLVTNHHVIKDGVLWRVLFEDDRSLDVAGVIDTDTTADLAILQVNGRWLPCLELADDELPSPGERVLAIGNPLGLTNTISDGLLSGYRDNPGKPRMLQTSAPTSQGSSGGPLFVDGDPRVVGVTTSLVKEGQNLSFAVPTREVNKLLRKSSGRLAPKNSSAAEELLGAAKSGTAQQVKAILQRGAKHDQLAPKIVVGDDEARYFNWEISPNLLVDGRNVLAVEIHQRGGISSDLGFDLQLADTRDEPLIFVPTGATWKYLDDGTDQGTAWREPDFDDSRWKSGPGKLGYGDYVATVVSYGGNKNKKHITTYFRHAFHVQNAASVKRLMLWLLRDDGAVVYLNGKLAVSDNIDIELDIHSEDGQGRTSLHLAAAAGNEAVVRLLLDSGALPNRQTRAGKTALDLATDEHDDVVKALRESGGLSSSQLEKLTAACVAAKNGQQESVAALIGEGVEVNARNGAGASVLHYAAYAGHQKLAEWLLKQGADVNLADVDGYRPLHVAVLHRRSDLVRLLADKGADLEARKDDGNTCLMDASHFGDRDIVAVLLEKGASINARSESTGRTALHHALGQDAVLRLLIERGADLNAEDGSGLTPLSLAVRRGLSDAADVLRQHGARVAIPLGMRTSLPKFQADLTNSIGMTFRRIQPGTFTMGSPESEEGRSANEQQHEVTLTKSYLIGVTEVTREQFGMFITESGYRPFQQKARVTTRLPDGKTRSEVIDISWRRPVVWQGAGHPVVLVNWEDAVAFCRWLSEREGKTYRLPTEAEWEYACRAGTKTPYCNGQTVDDLKKSGWCQFGEKSNRGTRPVGSYEPNAWGLYDMHGNVIEWTANRYGDFTADAVTDPQGPEEGAERVRRNGSWGSEPSDCRSASRHQGRPRTGLRGTGFRVVLEHN